MSPRKNGGKRSNGSAGSKPANGSKPGAKRASKAAPAPKTRPEAEVAAPKPSVSFPVVGVGASAGGLEAFGAFLNHVPTDSGMAFVVIQHLDPTHKGMLVELLQRMTPMPVAQVLDGVTIEPNHVYVIPPNKDLSLLHGQLHLLPLPSERGHNLPVDFFFRSLAEDQLERSIGVILSGMGSDGVLGLRAIKEKGGAAFVQALTSAKFDGMPRSAIDAGLADVVAPAEDLPARIIAYRKHAPHLDEPEVHLEETARSAIDKVFALLRVQTGNDFSLYKKSSIIRRIERRMGLHQIDLLTHYVRFLRENPNEVELLFKELLIGVTSFFRDAPAWDYLRTDALPALLASVPTGGILRAWVAGCSTGEEAYSLAIVFKEAVEPLKPVRNLVLQIFATDLDHDAIDRARIGMYPDNIAADVSPERLRRFFVKDDRGYRVSKEIREMVVFAPQNITMDPPFTKLDILSCRNLLIYLSSELQKKLIPLFHYSLNPGGILFLGNAETVGGYTNLFAPLDTKARLYRRIDQPSVGTVVDFPAVPPGPYRATAEREHEGEPPRLGPAGFAALADRAIVQHLAPVVILCTESGEILYISTHAGKYLEPPVGRPSTNIFAMAREGLRGELSSAFRKVARADQPVEVRDIKVQTNGDKQTVDVTLRRLNEPRELRGSVMIMIRDVAAAAPSAKASKPRAHQPDSRRVHELEDELQRSREEVQTTREEMQTSQEELKSTNEELQSTNEELQSTNEELTTSKEEMQSLNEELQTVNHELTSKLDELSRSNNDMKNLLNSTEIATLFLDGALRVRRFTTPTTRIIKLIPGDTGRPITDIASELDYPDLVEDVREVLRTLAFREKRVAARDGRWFAVRVMPYRTQENVIDGVVITFTDATAARALEVALSLAEERLASVLDSMNDGALELGPDRAIVFTNPAAAQLLGRGRRELHGRKISEALPELGPLVEEKIARSIKQSEPVAFTAGKFAMNVQPLGSNDRILVIFKAAKGG